MSQSTESKVSHSSKSRRKDQPVGDSAVNNSINGKETGEIASDHGTQRKAMKVRRRFCEAADPFSTVTWETRSASIKGDGGEMVFEQNNCEIPSTWSALATKVVVSKYFYGEPGTSQREYSVRQLIHRVCRTIADWGIADGYFATPEDGENFYRELAWLCLHQHIAFNSPVWFNVGLFQQYHINGTKCNWHWSDAAREAVQPENPYEYPQASACFIQSVDDNMEAIMGLAASEALLFKFGSGTGTDLSTLRSCREKLSGGGKPSGPLSFMRVYDQIAAVVKSGGKTRRAAKMQSLKIWHPDIMEFIDCKHREEEKARILVQSGLSQDDAYSSIMYQNANLSIRVTDEFMDAVRVGENWSTRWVTNPDCIAETYQARDVFEKIAQTAWACGDPGLQYDTTINLWHTCPNSGRINASNPCSEYMFLDDSACNLASVNLMRFRREDETSETEVFDHETFVAACRLVFIAQDILVDHTGYPIKRIAENSHKYRPLGLGYSNLGSLLMSLGLPYDSEDACGLCSSITALLHGAAYRTSAELAGSVGTFDAYEINSDSMLKVIEMHWEMVNRIKNSPRYLKRAAQELWDDVLALGSKNGFRNAQATVLAPTGTISFMMDCDTTGIEPDIALVKFKQLAGGGTLKMVNGTVALALKKLKYRPEEIEAIVKYIEENRFIEGAPALHEEHLPVFDCAFPAPGGAQRCIPWDAHVRMMAAAQPFISGAISKTVNMPGSATPQDIADAYMLGWELGLKALAVYRDGSKTAQPLTTTKVKPKSATESEAKEPDATAETPETPTPTKRRKREAGSQRRERLPDTRQSITHKFYVAGHEGYITVGLYPDNRVGELFITMAKEGSTIGGLMDCFATSLSMSLQYGVPLKVYVDKFSHTRFEPMGFTKNPDIPMAKSLVDYIFRWLGHTFLQEAPRPEPKQIDVDFAPTAPPAMHAPHSTGSKETSFSAFDSPSSLKFPEKREKPRLVKSVVVTNESVKISQAGVNGVVKNVAGISEPTDPTIYRPESDHRVSSPYFTYENGVTAVRIEETYNAESDEAEKQSGQFADFQSDAPACDACGSICVRSGNCYLCYNCGRSMGCS